MEHRLRDCITALHYAAMDADAANERERKNDFGKGNFGLAQNMKENWMENMKINEHIRFCRPLNSEMAKYARIRELLAPTYRIEYRMAYRKNELLIPDNTTYFFDCDETWTLRRIRFQITKSLYLLGKIDPVTFIFPFAEATDYDIDAMASVMYLYLGEKPLRKLGKSARRAGLHPDKISLDTNNDLPSETKSGLKIVRGLLVEYSLKPPPKKLNGHR